MKSIESDLVRLEAQFGNTRSSAATKPFMAKSRSAKRLSEEAGLYADPILGALRTLNERIIFSNGRTSQTLAMLHSKIAELDPVRRKLTYALSSARLQQLTHVGLLPKAEYLSQTEAKLKQCNQALLSYRSRLEKLYSGDLGEGDRMPEIARVNRAQNAVLTVTLLRYHALLKKPASVQPLVSLHSLKLHTNEIAEGLAAISDSKPSENNVLIKLHSSIVNPHRRAKPQDTFRAMYDTMQRFDSGRRFFEEAQASEKPSCVIM